MKFAGFIMTFEREHLLMNTIDKIFRQTMPPEKLLVVDNSCSYKTRELISTINNPLLQYYRVGYNSGPAGAAKIGLKVLADQGYDWIYWGDDDDPPIFNDTFEILLNLAKENSECGCVGAVGQYFNRKKGVIVRVPDEILNTKGFLKVHTIAGGMTKIVNGAVLRNCQIYPDEKLFFGFEELDFDLKLQKLNYTLLTDKALYLRHRKTSGRINFKRNLLPKKKNVNIGREYYSTRNLYKIYWNHHLYLALLYNIFKNSLKLFWALRFGYKYGYNISRIHLLAFSHFLMNKYGYYKLNK
ncbi:MAG: glycosyltransferase [Flavobacteriaceae bacterium]|nr:glycosyltransferase [Flavobacteriaceae bacterium]